MGGEDKVHPQHMDNTREASNYDSTPSTSKRDISFTHDRLGNNCTEDKRRKTLL
jgi:hypothetical protein